MDSNQQKINYKISSSVDLSIYSIEKTEKFWHQEIELIYVLSGSINIQCRNIEYNLCEDDIILINMFDIHTLSANHSEILSLKINISTLDPEISHFSQNRFDCNSSIDSDKSKFIPLKQLLASLVKSNVNFDDNLEFINKFYIYWLHILKLRIIL